jgi:beta-glucosidase-like glycosyl hydrolase/CubicO group peptidase (beta-lactamase class C family)
MISRVHSPFLCRLPRGSRYRRAHHASVFALLLGAACATHALGPAASPLGEQLSETDAAWVDATLVDLDLRHKVAQLVLPRVSGAFLAVGSPEYERVRHWIQDLGVGGVIETLGPPLEAAVKLNMLQELAAVPLLVTADMEHGPGQLFNGGVVLPYGLENGGGVRFPPAMGLGATGDERLAWQLGRVTAIEARAVGVHLNFAPVVDVNNNPANPIINTRSFGSDPALVSRMAAAAIRGMQEHGLLATAKHFPGHGDTETDSHINLPVITVSAARTDSIELPPYRAAIAAGVSSVMSAHIAFPALSGDSLPATLNPPILTGLLRDSLGFAGLVVSDALDMGAIVKGFGATEAPILALEAGADLLLQIPAADVPAVIDALVNAVRSGRIRESRIDASVRRLLEMKASLGLHRQRTVDISQIPRVLGSPEHAAIAREAAERSITLVRDREAMLPLRGGRVLSVVYREELEPLAGRVFHAMLREQLPELETMTIGPNASAEALAELRARADSADVLLFAPFVRVGAYRGSLALDSAVAQTMHEIAVSQPVLVVSFGSPYVITQIPEASTYLLAWGQWNELQAAAARALLGQSEINGRLPIDIPPLHSLGEGIRVMPSALEGAPADPLLRTPAPPIVERARPEQAGMDSSLPARIDSVIADAIANGASPGAAVAVGRHGRIVHMASYGRIDHAPDAPAVTDSTLWDLASLTKVVATTTSIMMLVDEGRVDLDAPVSQYLPEWGREDPAKQSVTVRHLLRHDGGLAAFGPIWKTARGRDAFLVYIADVPLEYPPGTRSVYSDYGAILLGMIVERVSGQTLDRFFEERIAAPLGLQETGFNPLSWTASARSVADRIAPTEIDTTFRMAHVDGRVHDENAYALGGVAGHAGLFSSARDLAPFAQLLLNGGVLGEHRLIRESTVREFTRRQSNASTRALGWDTPSGMSSAGDYFSADSFGHTGFTGTSVWIDRERDVFLVLLTNRVNPTRANQRHVDLRRTLADLVQLAIRDQPVTPR